MIYNSTHYHNLYQLYNKIRINKITELKLFKEIIVENLLFYKSTISKVMIKNSKLIRKLILLI